MGSSLERIRKRTFCGFDKRLLHFERIYALVYSCAIFLIFVQRNELLTSSERVDGTSSAGVSLEEDPSYSNFKAASRDTVGFCTPCRGFRNVGWNSESSVPHRICSKLLSIGPTFDVKAFDRKFHGSWTCILAIASGNFSFFLLRVVFIMSQKAHPECLGKAWAVTITDEAGASKTGNRWKTMKF